MGQIRKDFLLERYSVISESRSGRPTHFHPRHEEKKTECFFCPGNERLTPPTIDRHPKRGDWDIRVFRNKFPVFRPPQGDHEIVVETPRHGNGIEDLKLEHLAEVFHMLEKRRKALEKKHRYASIFKNQGREAGASLPHSHTQILAGPLVPTTVAQEDEAARRYYEKWHRCPWCDYVRKLGEDRIAFETGSAVAVTPDAPRFPYEVWIMPKEHRGNLSDMPHTEMLEFCLVLKDSLAKLAGEMGKPVYNFALHHAMRGNAKRYHAHLELLPRLATHAGYELGEGVYISELSPESAARFYRS